MFSLNYTQWLVILSALISIYGAIFYIRDTLNGKTKPNRITWLLWVTAPLISTGAAISAGADLWPTSRVFFAGFLPLLVFLASFMNKKSYWKLHWFDYFCGILSLLALLVWIGIDSPRIAIIMTIIAEGFAAIPTLKKCWYAPETETKITYVTSLVSVVLILPSIEIWNIENAGFQIYLLVASILFLFAFYRKSLIPQHA